MKYVLYGLLAVIGVFIILLLIAIIRTIFLKKKSSSYEYSKDNSRINKYATKLSKLVQFETISYKGVDQKEKFRKFHQVLEELYPNVFKTLEKIEIDGNLMMKWKGKNQSLEPIMLISHQDVVPVEGDWLYPPFSGKVVDGKLYGRGAADIKCGVMSFYQAVEELILEGYTPECDVYLGSSCTEEIGGDGAPKMVNWLKDHHVHLFMLSDEGGSIVENPIAGVPGAFAAVGIFEKGYGDLQFTAKSSGGHSSTPTPNTPIARLAKFITKVEKGKIFKVKSSPSVEAMFKNLAPYATSFWMRLVMNNMWLFRPLMVKVISKISSEGAAMFKTTICFTMAEGSKGYNVIPTEAYVTANLRYIPHEGLKESNQKISKLAERYNIETKFLGGNDYSKSLDLNGLPYQLTKKCIKKLFPNVGVMPYVVTGGTDSRFFDPVTDACVRFSPIMFTAEQLNGMHGINENLIISTLPLAVDYYKELIKIQEERSDK